MGDSAFILGLDLGVASIGWAIVGLGSDGLPCQLLKMGTHLFESGTDGDVSSGRDESRAGPRRTARLMRRQYWRRARRKRKLLRILQSLELMPAGSLRTCAEVDALIKSLDQSLRQTWEVNADHRTRQLLPYRLRSEAASRRMEPFEIGRALYHLAQRRGFLSNRRSSGMDKPGDAEASSDETSKVKSGIADLGKLMESSGCQTLAEYFTSIDPTDSKGRRIRGRWTVREMFLDEFERIWTQQAAHYPSLTADSKKAVRRAIFLQRPLKSAKHLVGECSLCPGEKRAPIAIRLSQRFRLLQRVNDLKITLPDHTSRPLSHDERDQLLAVLDRDGDVKFTTLRSKKYLNLPKGSTFNLEEGGETKLPGDRTSSRLRTVFGDRWDALSEEEKDAVVTDLLSFETPSALRRRGLKRWALDDDAAERLSELFLEDGHANHCRKALARLVPRMEEGLPYMTARKDEFPESLATTEALNSLPPLSSVLGDVRNPGVIRALTELRKVVNAVVRRYGKPTRIHIELTRDLKRNRKLREKLSKEMRAQETRRNAAQERIIREIRGANPTRSDIERVLLAEECGWKCPYTSKTISMQDLLGRHPQFDVEHIWPLSRSLDDSFLNKTLCYHEENRGRKKNRTPYEAYGSTGETWEKILENVKRFGGDAARIKFDRFLAKEIPDGFAERHLAETRYISAVAADYVASLYGGRSDAEHRQRVFVTTGGLTAHLRREWQLNAVLSGKDEKTREDHRHHAIDALIVALTDVRTVQILQTAAAEAGAAGRRLFAPIEHPWRTFLDDVSAAVDAINVSYRQSRRVSGKLHAETHYSRPIRAEGGANERRVRKELHKLSAKEVDRIVDPAVKKAVIDKLQSLGLPPDKAFADPVCHPHLVAKDGRIIPIHKVRIRVSERPWSVGRGARERHVTSTAGSNHHTAILAVIGANGEEIGWVDEPTTLMEAYKRRSNHQAIVSRDAGPNRRFKFSLAAGDFILKPDDDKKERLYRVLSISKEDTDIELCLHTDGRMASDRRQGRVRIRKAGLKSRDFKKVAVTYLGEIKNAGG